MIRSAPEPGQRAGNTCLMTLHTWSRVICLDLLSMSHSKDLFPWIWTRVILECPNLPEPFLELNFRVFRTTLQAVAVAFFSRECHCCRKYNRSLCRCRCRISKCHSQCNCILRSRTFK